MYLLDIAFFSVVASQSHFLETRTEHDLRDMDRTDQWLRKHI